VCAHVECHIHTFVEAALKSVNFAIPLCGCFQEIVTDSCVLHILYTVCLFVCLLLDVIVLLVFSVSNVHLVVQILNIVSGFRIICRQNVYIHNHNYIIIIISLKYSFCDFMDSYLHSSKYVLIIRCIYFQLSWWSY
jgi:hypothetical protein